MVKLGLSNGLRSSRVNSRGREVWVRCGVASCNCVTTVTRTSISLRHRESSIMRSVNCSAGSPAKFFSTNSLT